MELFLLKNVRRMHFRNEVADKRKKGSQSRPLSTRWSLYFLAAFFFPAFDFLADFFDDTFLAAFLTDFLAVFLAAVLAVFFGLFFALDFLEPVLIGMNRPTTSRAVPDLDHMGWSEG